MSESNELRCAVYSRKSSEEGLDQAFNSLRKKPGSVHTNRTTSVYTLVVVRN